MAAALITTLISEAPSFVSLIVNLLHPNNSTTIVATLAGADAGDAAAITAIQGLQAAVAAKNATVKPVTPTA
jgi:hypothetical protein